VILGGILGSLNLKYAYAISLLSALIAFSLCWNFKEPQRSDGSVTEPFFKQLRTTIGTMNNGVLKWVLLFYIVGYSLQHIPYEFYQPYIALFKQEGVDHFMASYDAALISGVVIGLSMFGGALGASVSRRMSQRFGAKNILLTGIMMQSVIIAVMAIVLHPAVLLIIVFRNFSMSMTHAPMHGLIAPRVASAQRATYLSLQSLFGRLAFSSLLFVIASQTGQSLNWPALAWIFKVSALAGAAALLLLYFLQPVANTTE
ncbi:MAG: MFS transporter, partial [Pseudomonadota bacterium]